MAYDPFAGRTGFAGDLFRARWKMRLGRGWRAPSQQQFADRFGLTLGMVKDAEQGRCNPSRPLKVLLALIEMDADLVAKAARVAAAKWPDGPVK